MVAVAYLMAAPEAVRECAHRQVRAYDRDVRQGPHNVRRYRLPQGQPRQEQNPPKELAVHPEDHEHTIDAQLRRMEPEAQHGRCAPPQSVSRSM
jgi:hypothetical protein